ncbi:MAG: mannosyl-3-phosphoglycerate phosphatase [Rhodothermaceae bacterium]|nr:MAG: mannosyl-3-phosphoglycerate phosphatase [Rhodothermaceae bacterium]
MTRNARLPVIVTDLDGTLLDFETYSPAAARPALERARAAGWPVIFCSSKTRAEQEVYRTALGLDEPFIVENGAALFVPAEARTRWFRGRTLPAVFAFGVPAHTVRKALQAIRAETGLPFRGFSEMPVAEVAARTGLDEAAAARARQRDYSETIDARLTPAQWQTLDEALAARGLVRFPGGRFHTITGAGSDKGRAVRHLVHLLREAGHDVLTIGLGDSPNDAPLLRAVDRPFLVQRPDGSWADLDVPGLTRVEAAGPAGWARVLHALLDEPGAPTSKAR